MPSDAAAGRLPSGSRTDVALLKNAPLLTNLREGLPLGEFSDLEEFMNNLRAVPNREN